MHGKLQDLIAHHILSSFSIMTVTDELLNYISSIKYEDISESALLKIKECLIDTIGVTYAGAKGLENKTNKLQNLLIENDRCIKPIGCKYETSLANAILINGLHSHFMELDDGVRFGVIHPSAPIFAALIPIAEINNIPWKQFVIGAICGYETSIRIAASMQPSHYDKGFHPTATCCTLGVSVAIAVALKYSKKELKDALSIASISACGTLKVLEDVSELKPYSCGKAALMGYYAAIMAKAGFSGPNEPLVGKYGMLNMMSDNYNEGILLRRNNFFYVEKIYLKPYASCRHTHPGIEAAFKIRENKNFDPHKISDIKLYTYNSVLGKHDFTEIYGSSSAKMSIPYSIAIALCTGKANIKEFEEPYISDKFILSLTKIVKVIGDENLSKLVPDKRCAILNITMNDGTSYIQNVEYPKGEPENPLDMSELHDKFSAMTQYAGIDIEISNKIFHDIMAL